MSSDHASLIRRLIMKYDYYSREPFIVFLNQGRQGLTSMHIMFKGQTGDKKVDNDLLTANNCTKHLILSFIPTSYTRCPVCVHKHRRSLIERYCTCNCVGVTRHNANCDILLTLILY